MPIDFTISSNLPVGNLNDDDSVSAFLILTDDSLGALLPAFFIARGVDDITNGLPSGVTMLAHIQQNAEIYFALGNKTLIVGLMTDVVVSVGDPIEDIIARNVSALITNAAAYDYTIKQAALIMTPALYGATHNTTTTDFGYMLLEDTPKVITALITENAANSAKRKPIVWFIEGYLDAGPIGTIRPAIDPSILIAQEPASGVGIISIALDISGKYLYLGTALGLMANLPVRENIGGHQKNDIRALLGFGGATDVFTNGELVADNSLYWADISKQGFLFAHVENNSEIYFYDDLGVGPIAHLAHCRVLFKAKRLLYLAYSKWQNEVVKVLPNGNIDPTEIMKFQQIGNTVLTNIGPESDSMLSRQEISAGKIYIDPTQKPLLNGGKTDIQFTIQPYGFSHNITGNIAISATI